MQSCNFLLSLSFLETLQSKLFVVKFTVHLDFIHIVFVTIPVFPLVTMQEKALAYCPSVHSLFMFVRSKNGW